MPPKLTLEGSIIKAVGRTDWIENPKKAFSQVYIPLTDIQVRLDNKDYEIQAIRGNPGLEAGDNVRLHFRRLGVSDDEPRSQSEKFMGWLKSQDILFPCKIEKLRGEVVVYECLMLNNDTIYGKEGYCPAIYE